MAFYSYIFSANYKRFFCYKHNPNSENKKNFIDNSVQNESYTRYVKVSTRLNIRSGAGIQNKIVGKLNNGVKVTVYETKENWSRIGDNIWVSSDYLVEKNITINKSTVGQYRRLKTRTYLYSKPNLTGVKYTYLAKTQVRIIKNISENVDYVYVVRTGRYAYVEKSMYK